MQVEIGKQYNRLVTLYFSHSQNGYRIYRCICTCGNYCDVKGTNITRGHTKSCGCLKREVSSGTRRQLNLRKGKKDMTFYHYVRNAKRRKIDFGLTEQQFYDIRNNNCSYCAISGPNGVDRVNNGKGYVLTNCVACCTTCNKAKDVMSLEEFKNWITRVYNNSRKGAENAT